MLRELLKHRKVYLVVDRACEDSVLAAFSTQEKAQEHIGIREEKDEFFSSTEPHIVPWELDLAREQVVWTRVRMARGGAVNEAYTVIQSQYRVEGGIDLPFFDAQQNLVCDIATEDLKEAIEIAKEKRAWVLKENIWGDSEALKQAWNGGS